MSAPYSVARIFNFCREFWPETHTGAHQHILYLHRLLQLESRETQLVLANHGLGSTEFDILATLRRSSPPHVLSPTELQRSTLLSSGGQTKVLHQLEDRKLITRSINSEDKRSKFVHLSPEGAKLVGAAMQAVLARLEDILRTAGLSEQEQQQFIELMSKILFSIESDSDSSTGTSS